MHEPHFMAGGDFEIVQAFVSQAPERLPRSPRRRFTSAT